MAKSSVKLSSDIQQKLRELGVAAVYLFGSRALKTAHPLSDFDFGVLFKNPQKVEKSSFKIYQKLYDLFSECVHPESLKNDIIDIVFLDSPRVSLEMKFHIVKHGKLLFDDDPEASADFRSFIMLKTADFAPLRAEMSRTLLARI